MLLDSGANPNIARPGGASPLWIAAEGGHVNIATALMLAGAHPSASALGAFLILS